MTKAQALQVQAAIELMNELQGGHRDRAYTTGNVKAADDARMECAADRARDALTDYLICGHVYGDAVTMANATNALDNLNRVEPEPDGDDRPSLLPMVHDYATGDAIRPATPDELAASIEAAGHDGGTGVITDTDGTSVYVTGHPDGDKSDVSIYGAGVK